MTATYGQGGGYLGAFAMGFLLTSAFCLAVGALVALVRRRRSA